MSKAAVSAWERNTRQPSAQQLGILCQRLGVTADYLLFGRVVRRMPNQIEAAGTGAVRMVPSIRLRSTRTGDESAVIVANAYWLVVASSSSNKAPPSAASGRSC